MVGSSVMFAIGPYFTINAKSYLVVVVAIGAGVSVWMAVGPRLDCCRVARSMGP